MILVDTSVWIDHLRAGDPHLIDLLHRRLVRMHPWIVGELACGIFANRAEVLRDLQRLPGVPVARDQEVLFLIERHQLMGTGIGWVDAQLAASALASGLSLWTRDKRLLKAIANCGALYTPCGL